MNVFGTNVVVTTFTAKMGRGHDLADDAQDALAGMLSRYFTVGALYGANPNEAFAVDTGNCRPPKMAEGELRRTPFGADVDPDV